MNGPRVRFEVLTLFPAAVRAFAGAGLLGRAIERGHVAIETTDYRDFTSDRHRTVDDAPFGGGAGMVLKPEPVVAALEHVIAARGPAHRILLTPSAPRFDQRVAERLATLPRIVLLCGRYEGIDDRVREHFVDECLSLGDFVLGGGEVAALAIIEAVSRLVEGVVGNPASIHGDSFAEPLLEFPQYTRPAVFRGHAVPAVLQGGDHEAVAAWRLQASLRRTWSLRPELRPRATWPRELPLYVAIAAAPPEQADAWAELCRSHGPAGLVIVGGDAELALAWTRALGGRVAVTAFADLRALRRRLRGRGSEPWLVAVAAPGDPDAARSPAELLDRLRTCAGAQRQAVVLLAPGLDAAAADAAFAPARAAGHDTALAPGAAIVDPSRPAGSAATVDRAIAALREP